MLTDELKKRVINGILDLVSDISDIKYQKDGWILGKVPAYSYDDTVCDFFDDCDPILESYKNYDLTAKQYQILKNFRDAFRVFSDNNDLPKEFIETSEWDRIMNLAKDVLKAFGYQKNK